MNKAWFLLLLLCLPLQAHAAGAARLVPLQLALNWKAEPRRLEAISRQELLSQGCFAAVPFVSKVPIVQDVLNQLNGLNVHTPA